MTGFGDPCGDEIGELIHQSFPGIREIWLNPETAPPIPGVGGAFQISPAWMEIFRRVFACPEMTSAAAALQADPIVSPAISSGMAHFGVSRSGGVLQPTTLPYGLIQAACVEIAASGVTLTEELLTEMTLDNLRRVRAGVSGETYESLMLTTFIGVRMTPGMKTHTPWGPLVDASRLASEIFFGPFVSGSAILMTPIRSFLRPGAGIGSETSPETKQLRSETRRNAFLVTYGLTLGSDHDNPGTMISAHTGELLPTGLSGFGGGVSLLGLQNRNRTPITQAEADDSAHWMAQLDGLTLDRIDIALRRLVRAVAERLDPLDSLIDAVIAWENLVEHRDQPTKSVLYGVSALVDDRRWSKSRIDKVYKARSDVVHGEPPPDRTKGKEMASAAIRIGLDAVRAVISEHPDKLEMTSEERVTALGFELPPTG